MNLIIIIGAAVLLGILTLIAILARFKKCPSDQIMVIYGKTGGKKSSKCVHGGASFIIPILQGYKFMSLQPLQFTCNLKGALSKQNIRVDVPTTVTIAISTEPDVMQNAAERLLGLNKQSIEALVSDIVYGQLRLIVSNMNIEELNTDREKFMSNVSKMIGDELAKIGLKLINLNITDIQDEAGYIKALGQKDKAIALNAAEVEIAKAEKDGQTQKAVQEKIKNSEVASTKREEAVSVAIANAERDSKVAEQERDRDINVATANSEGRIGEIAAEQQVVNKTAELNITKAEALKVSESANAIALAEIEKAKELAQVAVVKAAAEREAARVTVVQAEAKVEQEKELARKIAEEARAKRAEAALNADKIVPAEVAKKEALLIAEAYKLKLEKEAEADANKKVIEAQGIAKAKVEEGWGIGEGEAVKAKGEAEAVVRKGKAEGEAAEAIGAGEGAAISAKGLAEAEVVRKTGLAKAEALAAELKAQADGFSAMVAAAEQNPQVAVQFKMVQEGTYQAIAKEQAAAIQKMDFGNIQILDTTQNGALWANTVQNILGQIMPIAGMIGQSLPGIKNAISGESK